MGVSGRRRLTSGCFFTYSPADNTGNSLAASALVPSVPNTLGHWGDYRLAANMRGACGESKKAHGWEGEFKPPGSHANRNDYTNANAVTDATAHVNHRLCTRTATTPTVYS
jgi:hypothetical protein